MREFYEFTRKADPTSPNLALKERIPDDIFEHFKIAIAVSFDKEENANLWLHKTEKK